MLSLTWPNCRVSDALVACFSHARLAPSLRQLHLDLHHNAIGDRGVCGLIALGWAASHLTSLHLGLMANIVSDQGALSLRALMHISHLDALHADLRYNELTKEGDEALRSAGALFGGNLTLITYPQRCNVFD